MTLKRKLARMRLLHRERCETWHGYTKCEECEHNRHCINDYRANLKATGQDAKKILEERTARNKTARLVWGQT